MNSIDSSIGQQARAVSSLEVRERTPMAFDAATGLSSRRCYTKENAITVRNNSFFWWFRKPIRNARYGAFHYFHFPHPLSWMDVRELDEQGHAIFAEHAKIYLDKGRHFSEADETLFRDLRDARDTTYLWIRGLAILPLVHIFPPDSKFPEKHRDDEFFLDSIEAGRQHAGAGGAEAYDRRYDEKKEYFKNKYRQDDFIISGLAAKLSCNVRQRYQGKECSFVQNMLSSPGEHQSSYADPTDMPLRFHQFFVGAQLPTSPNAVKDECRFRIYLCCKNRLRIPIYIVRLVDILDTHLCRYHPEQKDEVLKQLVGKDFVFTEPIHEGPYKAPSEAKGPILKRDVLRPGDWIMCFDPERVRAPEGDTHAANALFELRKAVQRARRDAIEVVMKPRQILIVDNLRALISRREYVPHRLRDILRVLPTLIRFPTVVTLEAAPSDESLPARVVYAIRQWVQRLFRPREATGKPVIRGVRRWFQWPFRPHMWLRVYYAFPD